MEVSDKLIKEPVHSSKRRKAKQSWAHLNDEDSSTYLPSVSTNNHVNDDDIETREVDPHNMIVVMRTLLDPDILKDAIAELAK